MASGNWLLRRAVAQPDGLVLGDLQARIHHPGDRIRGRIATILRITGLSGEEMLPRDVALGL